MTLQVSFAHFEGKASNFQAFATDETRMPDSIIMLVELSKQLMPSAQKIAYVKAIGILRQAGLVQLHDPLKVYDGPLPNSDIICPEYQCIWVDQSK